MNWTSFKRSSVLKDRLFFVPEVTSYNFEIWLFIIQYLTQFLTVIETRGDNCSFTCNSWVFSHTTNKEIEWSKTFWMWIWYRKSCFPFIIETSEILKFGSNLVHNCNITFVIHWEMYYYIENYNDKAIIQSITVKNWSPLFIYS
jgi:hypothetical protein